MLMCAARILIFHPLHSDSTLARTAIFFIFRRRYGDSMLARTAKILFFVAFMVIPCWCVRQGYFSSPLS